MKKITLLLLVTMIVALMLLLAGSARSGSVSATEHNTCQVTAVKNGNTITVSGCGMTFSFDVNDAAGNHGGTIVLPEAPTVTVTGPPLPAPTKTVKVPGPVERITKTVRKVVRVPQPRATRTIRIPLPRATVTRKIRVPGSTRTVFVEGPQRIVTAPPVRTTATATVTDSITVPGPTETVTRQVKQPRATMTPKPEARPFGLPIGDTVVEKVGLGLLALAGFMGLLMLGLWLGYILGYKDRDREERQFLMSLRQQLVGRGKHS